jgi:hypothetical protein
MNDPSNVVEFNPELKQKTRKRRFWHPVNLESYSSGTNPPPGYKDGQPEPFEDVLVPDENGDLKPMENSHSLTLKSLATGELTCFVKWPQAYFGDKGRGPFTTEKKAKEGAATRKNMRFDADGKRM